LRIKVDFTTLIITLVAFVLFVVLASVGYWVAGKRIKGSCGGLNAAITNDDGQKVCGFCGIEVTDPSVQDCQKSEG